MRTFTHRAAKVALSALLAATAVLPVDAGPVVAAEGDKRPNLQMTRLRDWHIQTINGRRLLRFGTIFVNAGPGHFEVRGSRTHSSPMRIQQRMFRRDGTSRYIDTAATAIYSGDGHDHWHIRGTVTAEAWNVDDHRLMARGAKIGFCFLDSTPWNFSWPGARRSPFYRGDGCGTQHSTSIRAGLSVGWGDDYPWHFAFQWIDITNLPGGDYRVRATVDIQDFYDEKGETDNCVWTLIRIPPPGSSAAPTVLNTGGNCGVDAMTAVSTLAGGNNWDPPRKISIAAGTYTGYKLNSRGTELRSVRRSFGSDRQFTATARAHRPGVNGRYVYVSSGKLAGYWVRLGGGVSVGP
jgi:Lysyl oxidase